MAKMIALPRTIFALLALSFITGCASVTRGTKDTLVVESEPSGAHVRLSTGGIGTTPTSFQLPRKKMLDVFIEKEGYEPLTVHVSSQISGTGAVGMAGNVLIGGLIGVGVDSWTGAAKDLRPNPIKVVLVPRKDIPKTSPDGAPPVPVVKPPVLVSSSSDATAIAAAPSAAPTSSPPFVPTGTQVGTVRCPKGMSPAQIQDVITGVLWGRAWDVKEKANDHVIGHIKHRSSEAILTLVFDSEFIQMYCEGWKIDKTSGSHLRPELPTGWIENIRNDLTKRLISIPTPS